VSVGGRSYYPFTDWRISNSEEGFRARLKVQIGRCHKKYPNQQKIPYLFRSNIIDEHNTASTLEIDVNRLFSVASNDRSNVRYVKNIKAYFELV
jgi:hypothetical protein